MIRRVTNFFHSIFNALASRSRLAQRLALERDQALRDADELRILLSQLIDSFEPAKQAAIRDERKKFAHETAVNTMKVERVVNTKKVDKYVEKSNKIVPTYTKVELVPQAVRGDADFFKPIPREYVDKEAHDETSSTQE